MRSRVARPLAAMSATSESGIGTVGKTPDHSMTLVRNVIRYPTPRPSSLSKYWPSAGQLVS